MMKPNQWFTVRPPDEDFSLGVFQIYQFNLFQRHQRLPSSKGSTYEYLRDARYLRGV